MVVRKVYTHTHTMTFSGGCLCGAVRYTYSGSAGDGIACHCSHCRKYTGTSASLNLVCETDKMEWQGKDNLTVYVDQCDRGKGPNRNFCSKCGSPLCTTLDYDTSVLHLKAGSLDDFDKYFSEVKVHLYAPQMTHVSKKSYGDEGARFDGMP